MDKLKIIFVGTPDMALVCLDGLIKKRFNIVGVVPPSKNHAMYSVFKNFAIEKGLNFIDFNQTPNEAQYIEKLKALDADIGVVCSYNIKLSKEFLNTTKMGYLNCHPSLLPDYRGPMPYFHIINNQERNSGITLHLMDEDFDTGDIIYQKEFELLKNETIGTLFNRTNFMFLDALVKVFSDIQEGVKITKIPQNKIKKYKQAPAVCGYYKINWKNNTDDIDALIRACNPFYSAYCYFRGLDMKIIKAKKIIKNHDFDCGIITEASKKELTVATFDGFISIEVLQMASWGIFTPSDFYEIFQPTTQEYLT